MSVCVPHPLTCQRPSLAESQDPHSTQAAIQSKMLPVTQLERDSKRKRVQERERERVEVGVRVRERKTVHILFNVHFLRFVKFFNVSAVAGNGGVPEVTSSFFNFSIQLWICHQVARCQLPVASATFQCSEMFNCFQADSNCDLKLILIWFNRETK